MRRIMRVMTVALLLLVMMWGACTVVNASTEPTIKASEQTAFAGETVDVTLTLTDNPGLVSLLISVEYDGSALALTNVTDGGIICQPNNAPTLTGNPYKLAWEDDTATENYTGNGLLATLTFKVTDDAEAGTYPIVLTLENGDAYDAELNDVSFSIVNGCVTIEEKSIPVTGVIIDETLSVKTGETKTLSFTITPDNATNKVVSFATSDPSIAVVNETTGEVTGVRNGEAIITVSTADGGFTDTSTVIVSCSHTNKTYTASKAPSCIERGWEAYSQCDECGQLFNAEGDEISEITYLGQLPHTPADPLRENETAATCTEAGSYDEVVYCIVCGEELSRTTVTVDALGHYWGDWKITTEATYTEKGIETRTCARCGETETREYGPLSCAHEHTETLSGREATCTEAGLTEGLVCADCGTVLTDQEEIPALGHDYVSTVTPPTCTEKGYTTYVCSRCGDTYTDDETEATGHTPADPVRENETAATCTEAGSYDEVIYCSVCGTELSRETKTTEALGHNWGAWEVTVGATYAEKGVETHVCSRCEETETREYGPLVCEHEYEAKSDAGKHWQECKNCGDVKDEEKHVPGEWTVIREATETEKGIKTKACTVCGYEIEREEFSAQDVQAGDPGLTVLTGVFFAAFSLAVLLIVTFKKKKSFT